MALYIYPNPGSFNEFVARNPELDTREAQVHHHALECSAWRITSPEIDQDRIRYTDKESRVRALYQKAKDSGMQIIELAEWPKVDEYAYDLIISQLAS